MPEASNLTDIHVDEPLNTGKPEYMGQRTKDALNVVMATEVVLLDSVYTGEAITGMIEMARLGELHEAENMLFVHTDGTYCPERLLRFEISRLQLQTISGS